MADEPCGELDVNIRPATTSSIIVEDMDVTALMVSELRQVMG